MKPLISAVTSIAIALALLGCSGSLDRPKELPNELVLKLTGKLQPKSWSSTPLNDPWLELYNGSDWCVTDVDISVTKKKEHAVRRFRFSRVVTEARRNEKGDVLEKRETRSYVSPFATESMSGAMGDFLSDIKSADEWEWSIVTAYGFVK